MPKTGARLRAMKKDAILEATVDVMRAGAEAVAHPHPAGGHIGFEIVPERLTTHYFASTDAGYVGWCWAVTVARVPRGHVATVCRVGMALREGALLAPAWVPQEDRLRPSDISRDDVLPYKADDGCLVRNFKDASVSPNLSVVRELGLGGVRVPSPEGRSQAARCQCESERDPRSGRRPRNTCSTCGSLVKISGDMRTMFGVYTNEWTTDNGAVVPLDHTYDSHSETDVPENGTAWPVRSSHANERTFDAGPTSHTPNEAKKDETAAAEVASAQAEAPTGEGPEDWRFLPL